MYEDFFRLKHRPFAATPAAECYFPAESIESSRQVLSRCIERAEGAGMFAGPSGCGKTLLLHLLAEQFKPQFSVALLLNSHLATRRALLQAILFELGLPYRGMEEGELRLTLLDHLSPYEGSSSGLLLLIDEAHALPTRLMEEVRMITNVVRDGQPRVRLVLAGSPALEERLASPKLASLSQRLTARCYLQSMSPSETVGYIRAQFATSGCQGELPFMDDALSAVHFATDGIPRLVNQLCDHALMLAFAGDRQRVDARGIEEAWADLQQLPAPWNEQSRLEALATQGDKVDNVVEFGELRAEPATGEDAPPAPNKSSPAQRASFTHPMPSGSGELEEDFAPRKTKVPEAELFFGGPVDPFAERFADEEVIFDRYASIERSLPIRERVQSDEGNALSAMLEPFLERAFVPSKATSKNAPSKSTADPASTVDAEEAGLGAMTTIKLEQNQLRVDEPGRPAANELPPRLPDDLAAADDDVMIIEEDPPAPQHPAASPEVRRQEFGQLFASLRRG
ncbi:MAG TPA: AAA family ATPase [Pirellulales bacterium]|jgi:type II secretory pathway predicted ATPase ExeA|nr:AAA family ATPase [Pirellulales bacterium]